ncbi:MAG: hypothetical protein U0232_20970 [Thermomicrobiales bacterium]
MLLTPELALPANKTRQLYAALTPGDFSGGSRTLAQAERLRRGAPLDPARSWPTASPGRSIASSPPWPVARPAPGSGCSSGCCPKRQRPTLYTAATTEESCARDRSAGGEYGRG